MADSSTATEYATASAYATASETSSTNDDCTWIAGGKEIRVNVQNLAGTVQVFHMLSYDTVGDLHRKISSAQPPLVECKLKQQRLFIMDDSHPSNNYTLFDSESMLVSYGVNNDTTVHVVVRAKEHNRISLDGIAVRSLQQVGKGSANNLGYLLVKVGDEQYHKIKEDCNDYYFVYSGDLNIGHYHCIRKKGISKYNFDKSGPVLKKTPDPVVKCQLCDGNADAVVSCLECDKLMCVDCDNSIH